MIDYCAEYTCFDSWGAFGTCTGSCGAGERNRTRNCPERNLYCRGLSGTRRPSRGRCTSEIPNKLRQIPQSQLYCGFKSQFCLKFSVYLYYFITSAGSCVPVYNWIIKLLNLNATNKILLTNRLII